MRYFTPDEMKNTFKDEVSDTISHTIGKNVQHGFAEEIFLEYARKLPIIKDAKILDLGTAKGEFLHQLSEAGFTNLYAHDIGDYLPADARHLVREFKTADLNTDKLPWLDNTFDVVTAWCIIPHLENPFFCGREVGRVLKPGGMFIFTTPYLFSKPAIKTFLRTRNFGRFNLENNHIAVLTENVLKKTVFKGFDLISTEFFVHPKIFKGLRGELRNIYLRLATKHGIDKFRARWAYNICYFLRKR